MFSIFKSRSDSNLGVMVQIQWIMLCGWEWYQMSRFVLAPIPLTTTH